MILHTMEECQKWVNHKAFSPCLTKMLLFEVKDETNNQYLTWHVADISGKSFQHREDRIIRNINQVVENYPQLKPIIENLHIYICPKPSADTCNACASDNYICYFARSTQIPECMTNYITGHELGHIVQYKLCSRHDDENDKFKEYLELRNAPKDMCHIYNYDKEVYEDRIDFLYLHGSKEEKDKYHGEWDTSPQEWFAEDFRYLFGVDKGQNWEMPMNPPDDKIKEFLMSL